MCRREYLALLGSLFLVFLEVPVRIITLLLRMKEGPCTPLYVFFADHSQHNLSSVSATIDQRTSSIVSLPRIPFEPARSEVPYLALLPMHRILPTFVPYLATVLRSMSYRPRMATSLEFTACPTRREKSRKATWSTLVRDR